MERWKGIALIVAGSVTWGATGPMMEWLFRHSQLSVNFFLTIRLLAAGFGLLLFIRLRGGALFAIWRSGIWLKRLLVFSFFGMLGIQYTFVAAIQASNASIATLLQFMGPIYIILYVSWKNRRFPPASQLLGIAGTLIGLFFLLTDAQLDRLAISGEALLWGFALGIAFSIYTVYPAALMREWGVLPVVGWGMLISGGALALATRIWRSDEWAELASVSNGVLVFLIIFLGTIAFVMFLASMKYITPVETSVLSSIEPLTAMLISVVWLGQVLGVWQYIGIVVMLLFVTWLSVAGKGRRQQKDSSPG